MFRELNENDWIIGDWVSQETDNDFDLMLYQVQKKALPAGSLDQLNDSISRIKEDEIDAYVEGDDIAMGLYFKKVQAIMQVTIDVREFMSRRGHPRAKNELIDVRREIQEMFGE